MLVGEQDSRCDPWDGGLVKDCHGLAIAKGNTGEGWGVERMLYYGW